MKKKKNPFILLLIFLVGLAVAMYPLVSRYYYRIESNEVIKEFDETVSQMDKAELEERWRLAHVDGTPLPLDGTGIRSVIAGHRAEPSHVFFRHLDQLKVGDALYYDNGQEIVEYQMMDTEIILPSEWEKLESVSSKNIMTLITCDPIPTFNKRLLVNFERVAVYQKSDPQTAAVARVAFTKEGQSVSRVATSQWLYRGLVVLAFLGILFVLWKLARLLRGK